VADPDIRLCDDGGFRHSAGAGGNLICFPVSDVYFFVGWGSKSIAKRDGERHDRSCPLDPPMIGTPDRHLALS